MERFNTIRKQKKFDNFSFDTYCDHILQCLKLCIAIITSTVFKKPVHLCQNKKLKRDIKTREIDELRREYQEEKCYKICWSHLKQIQQTKRTLLKLSLQEKIKNVSFFGYVQCDLILYE